MGRHEEAPCRATELPHGETRIVRQEVGGGPAKPITRSPLHGTLLVAGRSRLAFAPDRSDGAGVLVVAPDGSGERSVSDIEGWPVWWPAGSRLAFQVLGYDDYRRIGVVDVATGARAEVPGLPVTVPNSPFDGSKDGRFVVVSDGPVLENDVWLLEPGR